MNTELRYGSGRGKRRIEKRPSLVWNAAAQCNSSYTDTCTRSWIRINVQNRIRIAGDRFRVIPSTELILVAQERYSLLVRSDSLNFCMFPLKNTFYLVINCVSLLHVTCFNYYKRDFHCDKLDLRQCIVASVKKKVDIRENVHYQICLQIKISIQTAMVIANFVFF